MFKKIMGTSGTLFLLCAASYAATPIPAFSHIPESGNMQSPTSASPIASTPQAATGTATTTDTQAIANNNTQDPPATAQKTGTAAKATETQTAATAVAAAAVPATPVEPPPNPDPYEKFNRSVFRFNEKLDKYVMKPVATFYKKIMPKPLFQGVHNFFNNMGTITTIANDILQLHFYQMANDMWRLGINTTLGIAGVFDIATRMGLPYYRNDFGLTLNYWGWDDSDFIVLPFFGANTIRDAVGIPVDYYEFSVYPYIQPPSSRYALYGLGVVDRRAQLLAYQDVLEEAAIDKYAFARNAYKQRRAHEIYQNLHLDYKDRIAGDANNTGNTVTTAAPIKAESASGPAPNNDNP